MTPTAPLTARPRPHLTRQRTAGLDLTSVAAAAHREWHLTLRPVPGDSPAAMIRRLASALKPAEATIVRHEVFAPLAERAETLAAMRRELGEVDWPVTWLDGGAAAGGGMHVFAVAGVEVRTIRRNGRPVGRWFHDGWAGNCVLADLQAADVSASKTAQAEAVFEQLEQALGQAGMDLSHVARTSFFLDDILAWYGGFNAVRTDFFRRRGVLGGLVPASTGVSGRSPTGAAVVAGAWAVQSADGSAPAREVPSPLQCPAPDYGSSFSRAVAVAAGGGQRLLVSGTASILPNGRSAHPGDVDRQVALTLEVVGNILTSRGLDFADATRATAYFKRLADAPALEACLAKRGWDFLPRLTTQADICRDELLFELELDAFGPLADTGRASQPSQGEASA